jgi:hypothetical protein
LVKGPNRRTYFWRRTIQWLFHQNVVLIEQMVSDKKIFMGINSHKKVLLRNDLANCNKTLVEWSLDGPFPKVCPVIPISNQDDRQVKNRKKGGWNLKKIFSLAMFDCGGHLGQRAEPPDIFLEQNHPMTISSTFSSYWANGFRQEDFYGNFP